MQLTPEIKQQLEAAKKQCPFCKIVSKEMDSKIVFEDDQTIAVLDINPILKGHTLFLLKEHYPIMPYIQPNEFKHYFGLVPQLSKAIKDGIVSTGINVFIANGGVAGQQAGHFMIHLLPRENGDGFFNFFFNKKGQPLSEKEQGVLTHNFPIMINNHFQRNPASWHKGAGGRPDFLQDIKGTILYEDEKVLAILPEKNLATGHIQVFSKAEEKLVENLSAEDSAHLFYIASFAATLVFEGLGAQGTNIILKSGSSDDNEDGNLSLHILPRKEGDSLKDLMWQPKPPSYDLDAVKSKIKDQTWKINEGKKKVEKKEVFVKPEVIKIGGKKEVKEKSKEDEIREAIGRVKR